MKTSGYANEKDLTKAQIDVIGAINENIAAYNRAGLDIDGDALASCFKGKNLSINQIAQVLSETNNPQLGLPDEDPFKLDSVDFPKKIIELEIKEKKEAMGKNVKGALSDTPDPNAVIKKVDNLQQKAQVFRKSTPKEKQGKEVVGENVENALSNAPAPKEKQGWLSYTTSFFSPTAWKEWYNTKPNPQQNEAKGFLGNLLAGNFSKAFGFGTKSTDDKTEINSSKNLDGGDLKSSNTVATTHQIDNTKEALVNAKEVLEERGEKINILKEKSDRLETGANTFIVKSKELKEQTEHKNAVHNAAIDAFLHGKLGTAFKLLTNEEYAATKVTSPQNTPASSRKSESAKEIT